MHTIKKLSNLFFVIGNFSMAILCSCSKTVADVKRKVDHDLHDPDIPIKRRRKIDKPSTTTALRNNLCSHYELKQLADLMDYLNKQAEVFRLVNDFCDALPDARFDVETKKILRTIKNNIHRQKQLLRINFDVLDSKIETTMSPEEIKKWLDALSLRIDFYTCWRTGDHYLNIKDEVCGLVADVFKRFYWNNKIAELKASGIRQALYNYSIEAITTHNYTIDFLSSTYIPNFLSLISTPNYNMEVSEFFSSSLIPTCNSSIPTRNGMEEKCLSSIYTKKRNPLTVILELPPKEKFIIGLLPPEMLKLVGSLFELIVQESPGIMSTSLLPDRKVVNLPPNLLEKAKAIARASKRTTKEIPLNPDGKDPWQKLPETLLVEKLYPMLSIQDIMNMRLVSTKHNNFTERFLHHIFSETKPYPIYGKLVLNKLKASIEFIKKHNIQHLYYRPDPLLGTTMAFLSDSHDCHLGLISKSRVHSLMDRRLLYPYLKALGHGLKDHNWSVRHSFYVRIDENLCNNVMAQHVSNLDRLTKLVLSNDKDHDPRKHYFRRGRDTPIDCRGLGHLSKLTKLKQLTLSGYGNNIGLKEMQAIANLTEITDLGIEDFNGKLPVHQIIECLSNLPKLRKLKLKLQYNNRWNAPLIEAKDLKSFEKLKKISDLQLSIRINPFEQFLQKPILQSLVEDLPLTYLSILRTELDNKCAQDLENGLENAKKSKKLILKYLDVSNQNSMSKEGQQSLLAFAQKNNIKLKC